MPVIQPVLTPSAAWDQQAQIAQRQGLGQIQQIQGVLGLQDALYKQQKEQEFRNALAGAKTEEDQLDIATKYMGPDQLGRMLQDTSNRRAQLAATREQTMARLQQAAQQFDQTWQLKYQAAQTADERLNLERYREAFKQSLQSEAARLAGAKANYDFGFAPTTPPAPNIAAPGPAQDPLAQVLTGRPPAEQDAIRQVVAAKGQPTTVDVGAYQAPAAAPAVPAEAPQTPASQYGPGGRYPPVGAQPATSPIPPMPPEIAALPKKEQNKWILGQSSTDLTSPDAQKSVAFWADVLKKGGSLPPGLARNREGAALVKEVMKRVGVGGNVTPEEFMSNQAEFMGQKAGQRTLGTREANIALAATEADSLSKLALKASAEWERTGIKTLNDVEKFAQSRTASPELRQFVAANTSFINAYARAINPQGVGTVADKEHAREMLEVGFSKGDYAAAIKQLQAEIGAALASPATVRKHMRETFTGSKTQGGATVSNW